MRMEKGGDLPVTGSCTVRHSRPPTDMFANFTWSLGFRIVIIIIVIIIAIKEIIITIVIGIIVLISKKSNLAPELSGQDRQPDLICKTCSLGHLSIIEAQSKIGGKQSVFEDGGPPRPKRNTSFGVSSACS